jgi:hypothetical protein
MTSYRRQEQETLSMSPASGTALELSVKITLTVEQQQRVKKISDYDLWFVAERLKRAGLSAEQIESGVTEFKKYMTLFALGYEELGMVSHDVDEVWHRFILFTEEYTKFCDSIFGKYIHHAPNTSRNPRLSRECVVNFSDAYTRVFGPLPSIWASEELKLTLSGSALTSGDCTVAPSDARASDVAVGYSAAGECGTVDYPSCKANFKR